MKRAVVDGTPDLIVLLQNYFPLGEVRFAWALTSLIG